MKVLEDIQSSYDALGVGHNLVGDGVVITVDTGFANEDNMRALHEGGYDAFIPDNQFRSRDPKFGDRLKKPSRQRERRHPPTFNANEFDFDAVTKTYRCPASKAMRLRHESEDQNGHLKLYRVDASSGG